MLAKDLSSGRKFLNATEMFVAAILDSCKKTGQSQYELNHTVAVGMKTINAIAFHYELWIVHKAAEIDNQEENSLIKPTDP